MILYMDSSALVKRHVTEAGSARVEEIAANAALIATALISRAEVSAALAKTVRVGGLQKEEALASLEAFRVEWQNYLRLELTETTLSRADTLAWEQNLRGYDAVHLACALIWQETVNEPVTLATFDQQLWRAAQSVGLAVFPVDLVKDDKSGEEQESTTEKPRD